MSPIGAHVHKFQKHCSYRMSENGKYATISLYRLIKAVKMNYYRYLLYHVYYLYETNLATFTFSLLLTCVIIIIFLCFHSSPEKYISNPSVPE